MNNIDYTGRFTRDKRVDNFLNSKSWKVSKDGVLYIWYDGHRLDFHPVVKDNKTIGYDIDLDKKHYSHIKSDIGQAKLSIINELIDVGLYPIRR